MTERVDFKLQHVTVATYAYRHEADLAAGFLDDAGIPYRLQVDDPALGMTIATPATIWVRAVDLRAAREVLELPADDRAVGGHTVRDERTKSPDDEGARPAPVDDDATLGRGGPAYLRVVRHGPPAARRPGELGTAERVLALGFALGAAAALILLPPSVTPPLVAGTLWAIAIVFGLSAWMGRTLSPLARLLGSLSGGAPSP